MGYCLLALRGYILGPNKIGGVYLLMPRRRTIKISKNPVITIRRHKSGKNKLVYIALANKPYRYPHARSRIVYIGTTSVGVKRVAASAASKAKKLLGNHGVKSLDFFIVSCKPLQRVETWKKLECGLIIAFKHLYGAVPIGNTVGKNLRWRDEREYFKEPRLNAILEHYSRLASGK